MGDELQLNTVLEEKKKITFWLVQMLHRKIKLYLKISGPFPVKFAFVCCHLPAKRCTLSGLLATEGSFFMRFGADATGVDGSWMLLWWKKTDKGYFKKQSIKTRITPSQ